ncbi:MAG TPA: response regulator [Thermoanaerobaculia bacterium]|nr:response regulator [Thermoanaerobaculia bacterium]
MAKRAVLVVEDDDATQQFLRVMLRRHDATVEAVFDGQTAIERLRSGEFDTVILDIMLPKMNGFQVAQVIHALEPRPKLIVLSGVARYFRDRFPEGTVLLQKPFEIDQLEAALNVGRASARPGPAQAG